MEKVPPKVAQFSSRIWTISKERKRHIYELFVLVAVDLAIRSPCWTPIQPWLRKPVQIPLAFRLLSESVNSASEETSLSGRRFLVRVVLQ
jgi:hypothetical protein